MTRRGWYIGPMHKRILAAWRRTPASRRKLGSEWYGMAADWCRLVGDEHGYTQEQVAGVVAALSPMRDWDGNLDIAERAVTAHAAGLHWRNVPLSFGDNNRKAWAILDGAEPLETLGGHKVRSFYRNITGDQDAVCIDRWMFRIARPRDEYTTPTPAQYERLADAYKRAAEDVGVPVRTLQAALWIDIRAREA